MTDSRIADIIVRMQSAAALARSYTDGMDKAAFLEDLRTQQAVIMNLVIIGELATKLLKDHASVVADHSHIPWAGMKGMRNRIAHGYFEINLDVVWDTVQTALPILHRDLGDLLQKLGRNT